VTITVAKRREALIKRERWAGRLEVECGVIADGLQHIANERVLCVEQRSKQAWEGLSSVLISDKLRLGEISNQRQFLHLP
jgi:hypothetical protein